MKMKFEQKQNKYGKKFINYRAPKLDFEIDLDINGQYPIAPIFKDQLENDCFVCFAVIISL